jgi:hypothetical protein
LRLWRQGAVETGTLAVDYELDQRVERWLWRHSDAAGATRRSPLAALGLMGNTVQLAPKGASRCSLKTIEGWEIPSAGAKGGSGPRFGPCSQGNAKGISPGIERCADRRLPSDFDLAFGFRTWRPRIAGCWPTCRS